MSVMNRGLVFTQFFLASEPSLEFRLLSGVAMLVIEVLRKGGVGNEFSVASFAIYHSSVLPFHYLRLWEQS